MRILAIRGRNIASLAGDFEVDFRVDPLASAGLFAICGPTGSGKSTILDAMCLALYDRTPRLQKASRQGVSLPDVGDDTITPQDARNLLRRGAGEGLAEVDFLGVDGEAYRARWVVRRARARVDGRLQAAEMSLTRVSDGQGIGQLKTEVLAAIEERLGLTFDQFTRAALLAQNEFTAFLQADDNTRAALLEQLTGTDIYTSLSVQAFERARAEQQVLDSLLARISDFRPLEATARTDIEQRADRARADTEKLSRDVAQLDEQIRWHEDLAAATRLEEEARLAHDQVAQEHDAASDRRAYLALVESVQPALSRLTECDRTASEAQASRDEAVPKAEAEAERAAGAEAEAEQELVSAHEAVARAEEALRAAAPLIEQARQLDLQLANFEERRAGLETERGRVAAIEASGRAEYEQARSERESRLAGKKADEAWLEDHEAWRGLARDWSRWDTLYRQAAALETEVTTLRARAREAGEVARQGSDAVREAAGRRVNAQETLDTAQGRFDASNSAADAFDLGSIRSGRLTLTARLDDLTRARQLDRQLADIGQRQVSLEADAESEVATLAAATREIGDLAEKKRLAEAALEQAERAHEEASLASAKSLKKVREALEAGRPCPVCGATEHPYAADERVFDGAAVKVLKRQLHECRATLDTLSAAEAEQRTLSATAVKRQKQIARELEKLVTERRGVEASWEAEPTAKEVARHSEEVARTRRGARSVTGGSRDEALAAARVEWFERELSETTGRIKELNDTEKAAHAAVAARETARSALATARSAIDEAARQEQTAQGNLVLASAAVDTAEEAVRRADAQRNGLLADLDPVGGAEGWRAAWSEAPDEYRERQERRALEYRAKQESRQQSIDAVGLLDVRVDGLRKAADLAAVDLRRAGAALAQADAELADKRTARGGLFDGRPVADVQRELGGTIELCRAAVEKRRTAREQAGVERAAATARLQEARRTLAERDGAAAASLVRVNEWIRGYNAGHPAAAALDLDRLRALLARDTAWISSERTALHALEAAFERTGTVVREREDRRRAIEGGRRTEEPADVIRARRAEMAVRLETLRAERIQAEAELTRDDENRRKAEALAADIERQQRAAALWARMNDLIGSADGKKFRNYAQQLTLDVLLGYANLHLADLARRYSLRRLEDRLALVVVDRDMADEVRSVYSLSGGESFLVSMALALGLASLSANRVRVESLFIDEGFGALDADTLSIAMDALDRVHAQGRKVGVISHVQELAERIGTQVRVERQSGGRSRVVTV